MRGGRGKVGGREFSGKGRNRERGKRKGEEKDEEGRMREIRRSRRRKERRELEKEGESGKSSVWKIFLIGKFTKKYTISDN